MSRADYSGCGSGATADTLLVIGTITRPHSLSGEVRVRFYSHDPEKYTELDSFTILDGDVSGILKVVGVRKHQDIFLFRFEGYSDRSAAERLRNTNLYIRRDLLEATGEDEFYYIDLEGLSVRVSETGEPFGVVSAVFDSGANTVLSVSYLEDEKERLVNIPFIDDAVETVSLQDGYISVKGMFLRP